MNADTLLGVLVFTPLVILLAALQAPSFWFEALGWTAGILSLLTSFWFAIAGFRRGFRWMLLWLLVFIALVPFANIVFWLVHRRELGASLTADAHDA